MPKRKKPGRGRPKDYYPPSQPVRPRSLKAGDRIEFWPVGSEGEAWRGEIINFKTVRGENVACIVAVDGMVSGVAVLLRFNSPVWKSAVLIDDDGARYGIAE